MRIFTFAVLSVLAACGPVAPPPDGPTSGIPPDAQAAVEPPSSTVEPAPPDEVEWPCATDSDCVLATRASLGCCDPCPTVEAMSIAQQDEIADLCGLHQGGETCPPMEPFECPEEEPVPTRAVCWEGACIPAGAPSATGEVESSR